MLVEDCILLRFCRNTPSMNSLKVFTDCRLKIAIPCTAPVAEKHFSWLSELVYFCDRRVSNAKCE